MMTGRALRESSLDALEALYRDAPRGPTPTRRFRGEVLCGVDSPFARSALAAAVRAPFERLSFGVDFGTRTWFFVHPRVRMGRFRIDPGPSRWREAETLRLRYDTSRLPIRGLLYDEVKPLHETLCLGLGGLDFERGHGDLFWFVLEAE